MNKTEQKKVKQFLYSIKRRELAIHNLTSAIEQLDSKVESMPKITPSYSLVQGAGNDNTSKQETWSIFQEEYPLRRELLTEKLEQNKRLVKLYYDTLVALSRESNWGQLAKEIIYHKYYRHVKPDKAIYTMFLFCAERTFYRTHDVALRYFHETIPELM